MKNYDYVWEKLKTELKTFCDNAGFKEVLLGLSGGMDSAFVFVLACQALGAKNVHAVMMHTKHTAQLSLDIARDLTSHYQAPYREINIQQMVENYKSLLTEEYPDGIKPIVIENLQARIRGQILMAMSNQTGALVLACGNKSEASVGYCTLYGDTCGGLSPIGDIYKSDLYALTEYLQKEKGIYFTPEVVSRPPSAELSEGQKDSDSLPPYSVLDAILQQLATDKPNLTGFEEETVCKVKNLYYKSAFKRLQMAPVIKIS